MIRVKIGGQFFIVITGSEHCYDRTDRYDRTDGRTDYSLGMALRLYMRCSQEQMDDNDKFNRCHCIGRKDKFIYKGSSIELIFNVLIYTNVI